MTREMLPLRKNPVGMQGIRLRPDVTEQIGRTLQALHPVLGSLHRAFIHEPEHRWTERSHRFLTAADCQHLGINPEWRPR